MKTLLIDALTCSLALGSSKGLMDHDARVGQRVPLSLRITTSALHSTEQQANNARTTVSVWLHSMSAMQEAASFGRSTRADQGIIEWEFWRTWWPEASRKAPMEAARPTQTVDTSGLMCLMVSNTAMPAHITPYTVA